MQSHCNHPTNPPPPSIPQIVSPSAATPPSGQQLRDQGTAQIEAARKAHVLRACRTLLLIMLRQDQATADDLRAEFSIPDGVSPNIVGAAFQKLKKTGLIQVVGIQTSQRAARHAGLNRVWTLTDRIGAEHWLSQNPQTNEEGGAA